MKFRTDISFLRAVAVLIVMFFHFGVPGFSGGFLGVDVFFVISGFLMTQIVLKNFENNSFSIIDFYKKRIKRIIPALQVVLAFVLLISIVFFFQADLRLNAKYIFLADFFVSNIYFWKYQDYFASTDNILLHSWTLGVEWQFYMIYPLILLFLRKLYFNRIKSFWIILSLICFLSFLSMIWIGKSNTNFIFYMLPSRFWELSIGGLAFGLSSYFKMSEQVKRMVVFVAIVVIIFSNYFISESILWPSILTLLPVLATFIILTVNLNHKLFNLKFVKFFGDISYSLYLWHWPWFILFKYFGFIQPQYIVVLIGLSILSAYLSYRFIETKKKIASVKFSLISVFTIAIISAILFYKPIIVKPFSIYQSEKFEIGNFTSKYLATEKENQFNPCGCYETIKKYNKKNCLQFDNDKPNVLLLGDSHAAQFSSLLRKNNDFHLLEASTGYVLPILMKNGKPGNSEVIDFILNQFLEKNKNKIDLVIISASWLMNRNANIHLTNTEVLKEISNTINFLDNHKIKYLFIGQSETYLLNYPRILMLENLGRKESEFIEPASYEMNHSLQKIIPTKNYINIFNSNLVNHYDRKNKIPYMFDDNHLTIYGADQVLKKLVLPRIYEKLNETPPHHQPKQTD